MVTKSLARFADIDYDPAPYQGNYSPKRPQPRDIPPDQGIAEYWGSLQNQGWKFILGLIATYGLRPHEAFLVDFDRLASGDRVLWVMRGKTGERRVWAFHPEWFEQFNLSDPVLPAVTLDRSHSKIGHSATRHFWEVGAPFQLYDLRHAWAIRSLEYGLAPELSARQMGHSVEVHTSIYQLWIDAQLQQREYDRLIQRPDRPKPPQKGG